MNSKIPIIALTADVTTVDLAKCKSVGWMITLQNRLMNDYYIAKSWVSLGNHLPKI
jgi:CheY-like chemotaxis protein